MKYLECKDIFINESYIQVEPKVKTRSGIVFETVRGTVSHRLPI